MDKEDIIDLEDMNFMTTMTFDKLEGMCPAVFKEEAHVAEIWEDYNGMGDVVIVEVKRKNGIERLAYGQFGPVEVGHLDVNTLKFVEARYAWPSKLEDFLWYINIALYNRFFLKNGKTYLQTVREVLLTSISNQETKTAQDKISKEGLFNYVKRNLDLIDKEYEKFLEQYEYTLLPGEEKTSSQPTIVFISPTNDLQ